MVAMERVRDKIAARAAAAVSETVMAPPRAIIRVGTAQGAGHVADKRRDLRIKAQFSVPFPHQPLVRIPSLMNDLQIYNSFIHPFESFDNPNI